MKQRTREQAAVMTIATTTAILLGYSAGILAAVFYLIARG